jgi:hypothetical protein
MTQVLRPAVTPVKPPKVSTHSRKPKGPPVGHGTYTAKHQLIVEPPKEPDHA